MELMSDPLFTKNMGKALPQAEPYKALGDGFGNISGQAFPEMCSCLCQNPEVFGPQGEPLFRFSEDQPRDAHGQWTSSGTSQSGDVKHTEYKGANRTIVVDHDTKANKITIKHLDKDGNLMVQQTHDSVGAARKELTVNGIDHKFYALPDKDKRSLDGILTALATLLGPSIAIGVSWALERKKSGKRSFNPEQPRDKSGVFSMGNVAKFESEAKGLTAYVTKFEGKFHVNMLKAGQPYIPGAIYSDKQVAIDKAKELLSELKVKPVTGTE